MVVPRWFSVAALCAVVGALAAPAGSAPMPSPAQPPLTSDQLIYREAPVEFQVEVNGEAAIALIGGVLDAAAEVAQKQLGALAQGQGRAASSGGGGRSFGLVLISVVPPLIEPAKEAIKSITQVTLLVLRPGESARFDEALAYYNGLMTQRGWTPLATVRAAGDNTGLLLLVAPGSKGLFGVLQPEGNQLVVGLITTSKPLGDLIAQIVRSGAGDLAFSLLGFRRAVQSRAPDPRKAPAPED